VQGAEYHLYGDCVARARLNGAWLRRGAHVNLVGASRSTAREADDDVVIRSRFFVDSRTSGVPRPAS